MTHKISDALTAETNEYGDVLITQKTGDSLSEVFITSQEFDEIIVIRNKEAQDQVYTGRRG